MSDRVPLGGGPGATANSSSEERVPNLPASLMKTTARLELCADSASGRRTATRNFDRRQRAAGMDPSWVGWIADVCRSGNDHRERLGAYVTLSGRIYGYRRPRVAGPIETVRIREMDDPAFLLPFYP